MTQFPCGFVMSIDCTDGDLLINELSGGTSIATSSIMSLSMPSQTSSWCSLLRTRTSVPLTTQPAHGWACLYPSLCSTCLWSLRWSLSRLLACDAEFQEVIKSWYILTAEAQYCDLLALLNTVSFPNLHTILGTNHFPLLHVQFVSATVTALAPLCPIIKPHQCPNCTYQHQPHCVYHSNNPRSLHVLAHRDRHRQQVQIRALSSAYPTC